jgi:short-subunit dehydrogenase
MPSNPPVEYALVTGASSGIGRDLARLLAADGHSLVLVARNVEALDALATELRSERIFVHVIPTDLADPASPQRLADELAARHIAISILVNNAGFGWHGPFAKTEVEKTLSMVQVNLTSLMHLTRLLLPPMIARGHGRVLNVASVAGFMPGPYVATYYATKAFVVSLSEALSAELEGTGVTVTSLCPGPTATDFHARAKLANTRLFQANLMRSDDVARAGYRGMMAGRRLVVPGFKNKLLLLLLRLVPRGFVLRTSKRLNAARPGVE